jgi:hypothetical protein
MKILTAIMALVLTVSAHAGSMQACYEKAFQSLNNLDSLQLCQGVGSGFEDCYPKAFQSLNNLDSIKACIHASSDFNFCYAKAFQSLNNLDSVKMCAVVKTCEQ